jgi:Flp pilus assembly pilin Flp
MKKRQLNAQFRNENGQVLAETCALRMPARTCPACLKTGNKRGLQVIEYAVLFGAITSALLIMYVYGKRGLQGIIKGSVDQMAGQETGDPVADPGAVFYSVSGIRQDTNETMQVSARNEQRIYNSTAFVAGSGNVTIVGENF